MAYRGLVIGVSTTTGPTGLVAVLVVRGDETLADIQVQERLLPALRLVGDLAGGGDVRWVGREVTPVALPLGAAGLVQRVAKMFGRVTG